MVIKHKIKMDLAKPARMPKVDVVQRDQFSRQLELSLYSDGESWTIPEDIRVIIYFVRQDGTGGQYDTLSNGVQAWSFSGNVMTVDIAPPLLSKPGTVVVALDLIQGETRVSTFNILLDVQPTLNGAYSGTEDDFCIRAYIPMPANAAVGQVFQVSKVDGDGYILHVQAVDLPDGKAAAQEVLNEEKKLFVCGDMVAQDVRVLRELSVDSDIYVDLHGNRVQGIHMPEAGTDAANKAYVDQVADRSYVPVHWQDAVTAACEKVTALQDAGGKDTVSFVWFSDCHVNPDSNVPNPGHTGRLAAAVMETCRIPFALMCGDAARSDGNGLTTEAEMRGSLAAAAKLFSPIGADRLLQVQGNHDGSWGYLEGLTDPYFCYQMEGKALYGALFRGQAEDSRRVFGGDGSYFYVDHAASRTRLVVLNSHWVLDETDENGVALHRRMRTFGYGNEQLSWLAQNALHFDAEGWAVVIAAHVPPTEEYDSICRDGAVLRGILEAFVKGKAYSGSYGTVGEWDYVSAACDFSAENGAQMIGFFAGHCHKDTLDVDRYAYPVATITSDSDLSYDESEEARVLGTANEHALDIVTIDRENGLVSLTRLGVGGDRSYALKQEPAMTNLADTTSADWCNDSRLNSSVQVVENAGSCVTNWIPCSSGDVIRISGLNVLDFTSGYMCYENIYLSALESVKCISYESHFTQEDGVICFTVFSINQEISDAWQGEVRFSGALTADSPEGIIITVNQEIKM